MTLSISYIGHTSLLIQSGTAALVTDPNFSMSLGLIQRRDQPIFNAFDLHNAEAVLVSNSHFHRLNLSSYKYFKIVCPRLIPPGYKSLCFRHANGNWQEIRNNETFLTDHFEITALPAKHTSARITPMRYHASHHYLVRSEGKTIFYGSDCSYTKGDFESIASEYKIDIVILPIDSVAPNFWQRGRYLNAQTAIEAFLELNGSVLIPYAYGSFCANRSHPKAAVEELSRLATEKNISDRVRILAPGEIYSL